jgi:hypothetical protein
VPVFTCNRCKFHTCILRGKTGLGWLSHHRLSHNTDDMISGDDSNTIIFWSATVPFSHCHSMVPLICNTTSSHG